jgi:hypothetical protein
MKSKQTGNFSNSSCPTKRAPDAGDSGVIPSIFLRLSIFPVGRRPAARPSAGNANRSAATCQEINQKQGATL